jgi:uncharacterized phage protein gp47/JayE
MLTLAQLVSPKTAAQVRAQLLAGLQGLGLVTKVGTGTGSLVISGAPVASYSCQVKISTSGEPGAGQFQYSTDGGLTFSAAATIPSSGTTALGTTGVLFAFAAGPPGAGTSFVLADLFTFTISTPTFPTTAWQPGSVPLTLMDVDAQELADLTSLVASMARGGYVTGSPGLTGASGSWLDLVGQNLYNLTRNAAIATVGTVTLTDAASQGPFNISSGQIWVGGTASLATTTPLRYLNTTGGTLPKGGTLTITVAAEKPGSAYNLGAAAVTTMLTSLPGVTVTNASNWISSGGVSGTDPESDLAYSTRCQGKWPSVGTGATAATYDYWARTASAEVTRTKVAPDGTTTYQVNIWLAGSAGPVSGGAVTAVQNYIASRLPLGITQNTVNSTGQVITITGTVNILAAYYAAAQATIAANLQALIQATGIGAILYLSSVDAAIGKVQGVRNVTGLQINGAASDLTLTAAQVATGPTNSLSFTSI